MQCSCMINMKSQLIIMVTLVALFIVHSYCMQNHCDMYSLNHIPPARFLNFSVIILCSFTFVRINCSKHRNYIETDFLCLPQNNVRLINRS